MALPRRLAAVLSLTLAASAAAATHAQAAEETGRLLVTLDAPAQGERPQARAAAATVVGPAGARIAGPVLPDIGLVTVRPDADTNLRTVAARLRARPGVARVEVEHRFALRYAPNDPALTTAETASGTPAGTTVQWWAQRQGLFAAWDVTRGDGATVAVIDTGADASHPELAQKIAGAIDRDDTPGTGPATTDETGHGTHVASLACAQGDDGVGIVGAGFNCRLLVIKSDLSESSVAAAILDAVDAGADAINMSFGTDGTQPAASVIRSAIQTAYDRGVILVAAAADEPVEEQGDPSNVLQPTGSAPDITQGLGLSVTAANVADQRASFAGFGTQVSLAAYGAWNVAGGPRGLLGDFPTNQTLLDTGTSTPPSPACRCRTTFGGSPNYAYVQGTSMAAPIVAAAGALVRHLNPDLTASEVGILLKQTARRPAGTGWEPNLGWGILDAGAAVGAAAVIDRRAPRTSVQRPKVPKSASRVTVKLKGSDTSPPGVLASGVAKYLVYRKVGGAKAKLVGTTTRTTVKVNVRRGALNGLYSVGVDAAGNREAAPSKPDVRLRVPR